MTRLKNPIHFLRTTAIGGLLFLLPLIFVAVVIGQVVPIVVAVARSLSDVLPEFAKTPGGVAVLIGLAIVILLALCFAAGLVASRSFGRQVSEAFEKKLVMLYPRYAIIKDQMADSIGGGQTKARMLPVLVRLHDRSQIGFETERDEDSGLVAVYLPGSPDPWAGSVALMEVERVHRLETLFGEAVASCEQLGRGALRVAATTAKSE